MMDLTRNYTELSKLKTFKERFNYLQLIGSVGKQTFGFDRLFNQRFYTSTEWKHVRDLVIVRDNGCDLGLEDFPIRGRIYIHHMNPFTMEDLETSSAVLLNPEYLISVCFDTHNAIHYGAESLLPKEPVERKKNDTCPWRHD